MTHVEAVDCPCRPESRNALGGGQVTVHRTADQTDGRSTDMNRAPDRICSVCDAWHLVGHWHLTLSDEDRVRVRLLRDLEREVRDLGGEGRRHVGLFVEQAKIMKLLDPQRIRPAA